MTYQPTTPERALTAAEALAREHQLQEARRKSMIEGILKPLINQMQAEGVLPPADYTIEYKD